MELREYFDQRVQRTPGCWLWVGRMATVGYGTVNFAGRQQYAHRVAWELANDSPVPKGLLVLHSCDNPPCVNPAHLRVGSQKDNMQDCAARRRNPAIAHPETVPRGSKIGTSKLTEAQVASILRRFQAGESRRSLARSTGISRRMIGFICDRVFWRHVEAA